MMLQIAGSHHKIDFRGPNGIYFSTNTLLIQLHKAYEVSVYDTRFLEDFVHILSGVVLAELSSVFTPKIFSNLITLARRTELPSYGLMKSSFQFRQVSELYQNNI